MLFILNTYRIKSILHKQVETRMRQMFLKKLSRIYIFLNKLVEGIAVCYKMDAKLVLLVLVRCRLSNSCPLHYQTITDANQLLMMLYNVEIL